jgi:6-phosphogluconolactonase
VSHAVPLAALLAALIATQPASAQTGEGDSPPTESTPLPADTTLAYVGTQTQGPGKGIFVFRLQTRGMEVSQNITLVPLGLAAETPNPSFLELDARRRLLFAVNEIDKFQGKPGGAVSAFAIDSTTGKLKLINQQPSMGQRPCHLTLNKPGNQLLVTNCGSGSVAVLPVAADGRLGPATDFVQHTGKSVNPQRQAGPHALGVTLDPGQQNAFACDLGLDKVLAYRFDAGKGKLAAAKTPAATLKPGAGPRRLVFRPDGKYAYVLNELTSTVVAFGHDPKAVNTTGTLRELQTVSTLPDYYDGPNTTGELGMHPSGKFLYVSNRGHNSVVLFAIDADKGTLSYVEEQNTGGKSPGHFGIEPSAKHLAIANQESNTVLVCRIDGGNGRLKPSGVFASVPSPTCVKFLPPKESGK